MTKPPCWMWVILPFLISVMACKDKPPATTCGDGIVDPGEQCDGIPAAVTCRELDFYENAGEVGCRPDCTFDTSACGARCGDGAIDASHGEECDGTNLDNRTCMDFGAAAGTLACSADCRFDFSGCLNVCGNALREEGEECDDGNIRPNDGCAPDCQTEEGFTCTSTSPTVCTPICGDGRVVGDEPCDGSDFGNASCANLGYYEGTLSCTQNCQLDVSGCLGRCGDGILQAGFEECDGSQLGGATCTSRGFYTGQLRCGADCRFDVSGCASFCGDGIIDAAYLEICDGLALNGATCLQHGYYGGQMACASNCRSLDFSDCQAVGRCGDGTIQTLFGEECDGTNLDGATCASFGFHGSGLSCSNCHFDLSTCQANGACGDGIIQTLFGEECDGTNLDGETCRSLGYFTGDLTCSATCQMENCHQITDWNMGNQFTCAVLDDGTARCWGANDKGQLGIGTLPNDDDPRLTPQPVVSMDSAVRIIHSLAPRTCVRVSDGRMYCWGENYANYTLGNPSFTDPEAHAPVEVMNLANAVDAAMGAYHTCVLRSDATVTCWGGNSNGQLGDGSTTNRQYPSTTVVGLTSVVQVVSGWAFSCARASGGTVWCWGANTSGQLGNGTWTDSSVPVQVSGLSDAVHIAAGNSHACAVRACGQMVCWGSNGKSQLGDGNTTNSNVPVAVIGISTGVEASAGNEHTCVRLSDGTAQCWGAGNSGQLGVGNYPSVVTTPTLVQGLSGILEIKASYRTTCARTAGDALWCWGANTSGQVGDGTTSNRALPTRVLP